MLRLSYDPMIMVGVVRRRYAGKAMICTRPLVIIYSTDKNLKKLFSSTSRLPRGVYQSLRM